MRLLLASRNPHKRRELARLLGGHEVLSLPGDVDLPPETGDSFAANSRVKALTAAAATGEAAFADDSGIEADALGGAPGIHSARYAGPAASDAENLERLRREVPPGSGLAYVCVITLVRPGAGEAEFEGRCRGTMVERPRGERGFGYDPVFLPDDGDGRRTMAELGDDEKDLISHRGQAARALLAWLDG